MPDTESVDQRPRVEKPFYRILVRVFHNEDPMAMLHGYRHGDRVREVFLYDAIEPVLFPNTIIGDQALGEQAFMLFNAPEESLTGREREIAVEYRAKRLRSLSVGDVVTITRDPEGANLTVALTCASVSWTHADLANVPGAY